MTKSKSIRVKRIADSAWTHLVLLVVACLFFFPSVWLVIY